MKRIVWTVIIALCWCVLIHSARADIDYDALIQDLKETPLKYASDDAKYYVENYGVEGRKLFENLAESYPKHITARKLDEYWFGLRLLETEDGKTYSYDEKVFLSIIVPMMDDLKVCVRAAAEINRVEHQLAVLSLRDIPESKKEKERAKLNAQKQSYLRWLTKRKIPKELPDIYDIQGYEVKNAENPSGKYVFLIGGIDGPSEPGGVAAYANLVWNMINAELWQPLLEKYTFCIVPNANPMSQFRYSPFGEGGIHLIATPDGRGYEIVKDVWSGNVGSVFDREDNPAPEIRGIKSWVSMLPQDNIIGFVSQHGAFQGAFAFVPETEKCPLLSEREKQRAAPTLFYWEEHMSCLGVPLDNRFTAQIVDKTVRGGCFKYLPGEPAGYYSGKGIFGMIIECGERSDNDMDRFVKTILGGVLAMLRAYEAVEN